MHNKSFFYRLFHHLHTINKHKFLVTKYCFKCGMYKQGLLHDLSKYSFIELKTGINYYQGYRSPITAEKEEKGLSLGWLHHAGRNKHHWEYWVDKNYDKNKIEAFDMPFNYLLESTIDRIAASKVYNKNYDHKEPLNFFLKSKDSKMMGLNNKRRYVYLLKYLANNTEEETLKFYKELYKKWKLDKSFDI